MARGRVSPAVAARRRSLARSSRAVIAGAPSAPSTDAALIETYRASLDATERAFSDSAKVIGLGVAFARYGRPDAVNMGGANDADSSSAPRRSATPSPAASRRNRARSCGHPIA
jgi:hypothetical protein